MRALEDTLIRLRPATFDDIPVLTAWDEEPHVQAAGHDGEGEDSENDHYWHHELSMQSDVYQYFIAELSGRPLGAMLLIDPHREPTHYWGTIEPNLRALDIWIGAKEDLGQGYGEVMMRLAFQRCFASPLVTAILIDPLLSNTRAHSFYQRLGFVPEGARRFGQDECLVHRLTRAVWESRFPGDRKTD